MNLSITEDDIILRRENTDLYVVKYIDEENRKKLQHFMDIDLVEGLFMRLEDPIDGLQNCIITSFPSSTYAWFDCLCLVESIDFDE